MIRALLFILLVLHTFTVFSQDDPEVGQLFEQTSTGTHHRILFIDNANTVLRQFNRIFAAHLRGDIKLKNRLDSLHFFIIKDYQNLLKIHAAAGENLFWMSDYHVWVGDKILTSYVDRQQLETSFRRVK